MLSRSGSTQAASSSFSVTPGGSVSSLPEPSRRNPPNEYRRMAVEMRVAGFTLASAGVSLAIRSSMRIAGVRASMSAVMTGS